MGGGRRSRSTPRPGWLPESPDSIIPSGPRGPSLYERDILEHYQTHIDVAATDCTQIQYSPRKSGSSQHKRPKSFLVNTTEWLDNPTLRRCSPKSRVALIEAFLSDQQPDLSSIQELQKYGFVSPGGAVYTPRLLRTSNGNGFYSLAQMACWMRRSEAIKIAGRVTRKIRSQILLRDHGRCKLCSSTERLTIDHVWPVSRGGKTVFDNLQVLCAPCNIRKGNSV